MLKKITIPSLFLLIITAASILLCHGLYLQRQVLLLCGLALAALSPLLFAVSLRRALPSGGAVPLLTTGIVLAAGVCITTGRTCREKDYPVPTAPFMAVVDTVMEKRYHNEITMTSRSEDGKADCPAIRILGFAEHGVCPDRGDVLVIKDEPKILSRQSPSPYELGLLMRGFSGTVRLDEENHQRVPGQGPDMKKKIRSYISRILESCYSRRQAAFLKSLYFGNTAAIEKALLTRYRQAGVIHVLAASGLHVGIVAAIPLMLAGLIRTGKRTGHVLATVLVTGYLYITDEPVSLLRACVMYFLFCLQYGFSLEKNAFNLLFLAGISILALQPHELYSPAFHLSFGATAGILALYQVYRGILPRRPAAVGSSFALTVSAQMLTVPIIVFHFNEINFIGLLSNCVIIPLVSMLLIASIPLCLLYIPFSSLAVLTGSLLEWPFNFLGWCVSLLSSGHSHFYVTGSRAAAAVLVPFIFLLPLLAGRRKRKMVVLASCFLYLGLWIFFSCTAPPPRELTLFRHERGICLFIREEEKGCLIGDIPCEKAALIIEKSIIVSQVESLALYVPRPDYPNLRYFGRLIKRFPVSSCTMGNTFGLNRPMRQFLQLIERDDIAFRISPGLIPERRVSIDDKKQLSYPINIDSENTILYIYSTFTGPVPGGAESMVPPPAAFTVIDITKNAVTAGEGPPASRDNDNTAEYIAGQKKHGEHLQPD